MQRAVPRQAKQPKGKGQGAASLLLISYRTSILHRKAASSHVQLLASLPNILPCPSFLVLFWPPPLRVLFLSAELFLSGLGPFPFTLLAATHVFPIPLGSWELIPLWVVCKRSVEFVLVPDYLIFYF